MRAAKALGLTEIPYFYNNEVDITISQILAGIFHKNLNPIEEGKAFRKYMNLEKVNVEVLAKKISKQITYVNKRLLLVDLPGDVQEALIKNKILIGHALLLAKLPKQDSSKYLKQIIRSKHSVADSKEEIQYHGFTVNLDNANFDKSSCKHCKYNGSEQAELFETGTILNGECMNPSCYHKKVKELVTTLKKTFKDVLFKGESEWSSPKGYIDGESWECNEAGITSKYKTKCRMQKDYLVVIKDNGNIIEFFKKPTKESKKVGKEEITEKEVVRQDKLLCRVNEFKTEFLIKKSIELMQPGTKQAKVLTLIKLIRSANWNEVDEMREMFKINKIKKIYDLKEKEIDKAISVLSKKAFRLIDLKELIVVSRNFKVDIKKHFEIIEDYLELYTKSQLLDLIEELKIGTDQVYNDVKKGDIINYILSQNLKGKIPKILF